MQTKTLLTAIFVLPLLLMACNRADNSPTAATPAQSQEKQAMSPDKMFERSPPAAGAPMQSDNQATTDKPTAPPSEANEAPKKAN